MLTALSLAKNIKALVAPDVTAFKPACVKSVSKVKLLPADPSDCVVVLLIELTVPKTPPAPEATVKPPDVVVEYDEKTIEPIKKNRRFKLNIGKINKAF